MYRIENIREEGKLVRRRIWVGEQVVSDMSYGVGASGYPSPRGLAREWYPTGELRRERQFDDTGAVVGADTTWWPNGTMRAQRHRYDRANEGHDRKWYSDGTPRMLGQWLQGKRVGAWRWYFPTGNVRLEVDYVDGRPHGEFRLWDGSGGISLEGLIEHGLPTGSWRAGKHSPYAAASVSMTPPRLPLEIFDIDGRPIAVIS